MQSSGQRIWNKGALATIAIQTTVGVQQCTEWTSLLILLKGGLLCIINHNSLTFLTSYLHEFNEGGTPI